jgi:hypothetical protein
VQAERGVTESRLYILAVIACGVLAAQFGQDLATLFNWMFICYMVFAPTVAISLFVRMSSYEIIASFVLALLLFIVLFLAGILSLENSYWLSLPALIFSIPGLIRRYAGSA